MDSFTQFEHEGWARVADKYDSVWSTSTRQFIAPLLDAAAISSGVSILDVGCGPGYVSAAAAERGALPRGLDFSKEMIAIAQKKCFRTSNSKRATRKTFPSPTPASIGS
jgi:2-polyprenyl-3-methyl-5-hydroxy-6-metoxy-1,4-benzoquinol methylase